MDMKQFLFLYLDNITVFHYIINLLPWILIDLLINSRHISDKLDKHLVQAEFMKPFLLTLKQKSNPPSTFFEENILNIAPLKGIMIFLFKLLQKVTF